MDTSTLSLILRALLLFLSFTGLTAFVRGALKLNRFIAPAFAAGSIIVVLMLAGMLHVLEAGFYFLYIGGFAGFIYTYLIRKVKPDFALIGLFILICAYLGWRYLPSLLYLTDDFSHWGLVSRYLLENNAFPDASTPLVSFQSYPFGSTCFYYYIGRTLSNSEGLWSFAQNLLYCLLILPIFANIRKNRKVLLPIFPVLFLILFKNTRPMLGLYVDWLLAYFGIAMAATVIYYRDNPTKAFWAAFPGILASVFLKNSGIFFSLCTALMLVGIARNSGKSRSYQWKIFLAAFLSAIAAFLLWTLHVKLSFPSGLETKHAVSLSSYAETASGKDWKLIITIAGKMALAWLVPIGYHIFTLLFGAMCFGITLYVRKKYPAKRELCNGIFKALIGCIIIYIVWYALVFAMYIFSMPAGEARRISAYPRYDSTGTLYITGLGILALFILFSNLEIRPVLSSRLVCLVLAIVGFLTLPALSYGDRLSFKPFYEDMVTRETEYTEYRLIPQTLHEAHDIPEYGAYIIYDGPLEAPRPLVDVYYCARYELYSSNIIPIGRMTAEKYADAPYVVQTTLTTRETFANPFDRIAEIIDECDAFLIYRQDPAFELLLSEFLSTYTGDTPVIYAYQ